MIFEYYSPVAGSTLRITARRLAVGKFSIEDHPVGAEPAISIDRIAYEGGLFVRLYGSDGMIE